MSKALKICDTDVDDRRNTTSSEEFISPCWLGI